MKNYIRRVTKVKSKFEKTGVDPSNGLWAVKLVNDSNLDEKKKMLVTDSINLRSTTAYFQAKKALVNISEEEGHLAKMPNEILANIIMYLYDDDLKKLCLVNKRLNNLVNGLQPWKSLRISNMSVENSRPALLDHIKKCSNIQLLRLSYSNSSKSSTSSSMAEVTAAINASCSKLEALVTDGRSPENWIFLEHFLQKPIKMKELVIYSMSDKNEIVNKNTNTNALTNLKKIVISKSEKCVGKNLKALLTLCKESIEEIYLRDVFFLIDADFQSLRANFKNLKILEIIFSVACINGFRSARYYTTQTPILHFDFVSMSGPQLTTLELVNCNLSQEELHQIFLQLTNLQFVHLLRSHLNEAGLIQMIGSCGQSLISLRLRDCPYIGRYDKIKFDGLLPNLTTLDFECTPLRDKALFSFLISVPDGRLESLNLAKTDISGAVYFDNLGSRLQNLKLLDLSDCQFLSDPGLKRFLKPCGEKIRELYISGTPVTGKYLNECKLDTIKKLDISYAERFTDRSLRLFMECPSSNRLELNCEGLHSGLPGIY